jgi:hypothetical protein
MHGVHVNNIVEALVITLELCQFDTRSSDELHKSPELPYLQEDQ